ncbi:hypothetical protein BLOT_007120 [Blomia tropicalis]|nr:hypothetical protein BLOT_007120 [Blomia tropicalis]
MIDSLAFILAFVFYSLLEKIPLHESLHFNLFSITSSLIGVTAVHRNNFNNLYDVIFFSNLVISVRNKLLHYVAK